MQVKDLSPSLQNYLNSLRNLQPQMKEMSIAMSPFPSAVTLFMFRGPRVVDGWPSPYIYGNDCQFGFSGLFTMSDSWFHKRSVQQCYMGDGECLGCVASWVLWDPSDLGNYVPNERPMDEKCRRVSLAGYQMHSPVEKNICSDERNSSWETI